MALNGNQQLLIDWMNSLGWMWGCIVEFYSHLDWVGWVWGGCSSEIIVQIRNQVLNRWGAKGKSISRGNIWWYWPLSEKTVSRFWSNWAELTPVNNWNIKIWNSWGGAKDRKSTSCEDIWWLASIRVTSQWIRETPSQA